MGESLSTGQMRPPSGQTVGVEAAAAAARQSPAAVAATAAEGAGGQGLRCGPPVPVGPGGWSLRPRPTNARSRPPGAEGRRSGPQ